MAKIEQKYTEVNRKSKKDYINEVLKAVVIISCLLGLDRAYLITKAPLYLIISKLYAGCVVISTVAFYVKLYLKTDHFYIFIDEYISALQYCGMIVLQVLRSKKLCKDFLENINFVDESLKLKGKNNLNNSVRYFSILCLVQSILVPVIAPVIFWIHFDKIVPLQSFILMLLFMMYDTELVLLGNVMIVVETRIRLVNAHLKKRLVGSEEQSYGDENMAEAAKRTELDTYDLYQIYVKVFSCHENLKMYMHFSVTLLMVNTFFTTHNTFVRITDYVTDNVFGVERNAFVYLYIGVSALKCFGGLAILGALGSRTSSAAATIPHTLADILAGVYLDKSERRRLKGFLRSCAERPFHYALCGIVPLDVMLPVNFVALSVSYIVVGTQFIGLRIRSGLH